MVAETEYVERKFVDEDGNTYIKEVPKDGGAPRYRKNGKFTNLQTYASNTRKEMAELVGGDYPTATPAYDDDDNVVGYNREMVPADLASRMGQAIHAGETLTVNGRTYSAEDMEQAFRLADANGEAPVMNSEP